MGLSLVVDISAAIQGQSGQQFKTTSSGVTSKVIDNQMNEGAAVVRTAVYWKLQRILKNV